MPYRSTFARPVFNKTRALPRMSWTPENLYNLWQRVANDGPLKSEAVFTRTSLTLYQQRWRAKRLSRGYHGDQIPEQKFERWFLPDALPSIHSSTTNSGRGSTSRDIARMVAGRSKEGGRAETERTVAMKERLSRTPIGTMLYREVERRLDTLVFRACFATSVYGARQLVVHRKVKVNGEVVNNPNTRLNPGDLFSVDPAAIDMLQKQTADLAAKSKASRASKAVFPPSEQSKTEPSSESETETASSSESPSSTPKTPSPSLSTSDAYFTLPPYAAPHLFVPAYIEPNFKTCAAVYVRHPTARPGYSEIPSPYDADGEIMSLAWEWFSKKAPDMTKRRHRWMNPERTSDRK